MKSLRTNLFYTTLINKEIEANHGNLRLLECLSHSYRRHFPVKFAEKESLRATEGEKSKCNNQNDPSVSTEIPKHNKDNQLDNSCDEGAEVKEHTTSDEINTDASSNNSEDSKNSLETNGNMVDAHDKIQPIKSEEVKCPLLEKGISCHNLKWQDYMNEICTAKSTLVDAIITEPPSAPSRSFLVNKNNKRKISALNEELPLNESVEAARFGERMLKPGGYFIVLITIDMFQEWYEACLLYTSPSPRDA